MHRILGAVVALAALLDLKTVTGSSLPQQIPFALPKSIATTSYLPQSHLNALENSDSVVDEMLVRLTLPEEPEEASAIVEQFEDAGYDIWQRRPGWIDFRAKLTDVIEATYKRHSENIEIFMPSLREAIARERTSQEAQVSLLADSVHSIYHSLSGIESLLQLLASDYPDYARLQEIGKSAEGKSIYALSISDYREKPSSEGFRTWREFTPKAAMADKKKGKGGKKHKGKLGFALVGGQHAREWISPAALLYVAHDMLVQFSDHEAPNHEDVVTALQDYEYHFIPMINPDGYDYSWNTDRLWTKNRQYTTSNETRCHGIDLNRNWGYKFSKAMRPNPCSDLYTGNEAFEAVELDVVSKWLKQKSHEKGLQVFLDVHSFGQMLMYPYSFSCTAVPPDAENLYEALIGAGKALKSVHHQTYDAGSVCDVSYTATGQSLDWTYHDLHAKWSFAINLRDQGVYAFLLPPEYIIETGQEFLAGILDLSRFIAQKEKIEN